MQVIAQSPGQVTLLLFFDGLFCRFMLIFRTGINFTATALPDFFHQRCTSISLARGSSKRAALSVSRDSLAGYIQKQRCVYRA
jgi:hypothetical protein